MNRPFVVCSFLSRSNGVLSLGCGNFDWRDLGKLGKMLCSEAAVFAAGRFGESFLEEKRKVVSWRNCPEFLRTS